MKARRGIRIAAALGALLTAPGSILAKPQERTPVSTTSYFEFYSDFATNLNDALIAAGAERNHQEPELFGSGEDKTCFDALPPSVRAGWDGAVDYYAKIISPHDWIDRRQYLIRVRLAGLAGNTEDDAARQFIGIAESFRAAGAPAYEACRWTAQDAENRRWIEDLKAPLAAQEARIGKRLEELYRKPWFGLPMLVDVVETVSWSGANSVFPGPGRGHLLVSNSYRGPAALEVVFHEASHQLMLRGTPVETALRKAAEDGHVPLPGDLWHIVLFYTTGEAVRASLEKAGQPGYEPMIYGIFKRNERWAGYREALEKTWPAYMDGKRTLPEAASDLLRALPVP